MCPELLYSDIRGCVLSLLMIDMMFIDGMIY